MIVGCVFDDGRSVVYKLVVSAVSSVSVNYLMFVTRCRIYLGRLGIGSVKFFEIAA